MLRDPSVLNAGRQYLKIAQMPFEINQEHLHSVSEGKNRTLTIKLILKLRIYQLQGKPNQFIISESTDLKKKNPRRDRTKHILSSHDPLILRFCEIII